MKLFKKLRLIVEVSLLINEVALKVTGINTIATLAIVII